MATYVETRNRIKEMTAGTIRVLEARGPVSLRNERLHTMADVDDGEAHLDDGNRGAHAGPKGIVRESSRKSSNAGGRLYELKGPGSSGFTEGAMLASLAEDFRRLARTEPKL